MTAVCPACDAADYAVDVAARAQTVALSVPTIRCAACIGSIEKALNDLPGVREARVNLTLKRVSVVTNLPAEQLVATLEDAGYPAHPFDAAALGQATDAVGRDLLMRMGIAGFAMMNVMLLSVAVWSGATDATRDLFHLISAGIALPAALYAAQPFFENAMRALKAGHLNMDVPISLAIILAGGMSLYEALNGGAHAYFDAALSLTFFLLIGRYLEHRTRAAARSAATELSALEVRTALRKVGDTVEDVALDALKVGDAILVPTGVRVPVDGPLTSAESFTDRSFLTGESDPVTHCKGDLLQAGEINLGAPFEMTAEALGQDTRLSRIARLVETAENVRNRYTTLADKAASFYAPAVHLLAAATFLGWLLVSGDPRHSLNIAIAVLIITCPCALGLAVPAVSTAAIGHLYRRGLLVKSGSALERLAEVNRVILDKTGTLTKPGFDFDLGTLTESDKSVAMGLAQASSHPVSLALRQYLGATPAAQLSDVKEHSGRGISAKWGETKVALGKPQWVGTEGTGLGFRISENVYLLPAHEIERPGAGGLVEALHEQGFDETEMISGDNVAKTRALAGKLGIARWLAGVSPEAKHQHVDALKQEGQRPCMVGDGINDTVALTAAHASVAPGTALDAARNAADVVMLNDTLADLPILFATARKAVSLYRQNFGIAFCYNAVAIPIAVMGFATPLMAALAMSFSSITVLLNAMRARTVR